VKPPALAQQLAAAARLLAGVAAGQSPTAALAALPAGLRPGVQALLYDALRHWGLTQALRRLLCRQEPPALACALLELSLGLLEAAAEAEPVRGAEAGSAPGAYLWASLGPTKRPLYVAHTLVDQAVAALPLLHLPAALKGFVNACLRRFLRERPALLKQALADPVARHQHPQWWIELLQHEQAAHWQAILQANQRPAPLVLRVNRRRCTRSAYLQHLQAAGLAAQACAAPDAIVLAQPLPVEQLPGWALGWVSVQDAAAQLAAPLLLGAAVPALPKARLRLLDACAAPGGKTAHLLECADAEVLALDLDAQRCSLIAHGLQRLGLQAQVRCADAAQPATWWDGQPFDAILLDAPCSASGIVRRHPDIPWLRRPGDIAQLAAQQRCLLEALWPLLRPGGHLLYATCSVFAAEGAQQIEAFVQRHPEASALPAPGLLLPAGLATADAGAKAAPDSASEIALGAAGAHPHTGDQSMGDNCARETDGFYYALLHQRA